MSAQDELVDAELTLLHTMLLSQVKPEDHAQWQEKIDDIRDQYQEARRIEGDANATAAQRKYAKEVGDSIAKGLPLMTKGLQTAITAFSKGDAITGSAAIMDICAAAAPIIGAIFSSTGPEGMLVGAIFSVIGQILALFMPKQPSMVDQINDLLKTFNTEEQLQKLGAIHLALEEYDLNLKQA